MLGVKKVEIDFTECSLAVEYALKYKQLSTYDRIALAIAKNRKIALLTGDGRLRAAAKKEFVTVIGTLGILDRLYAYDHISEEEYDECLNEIKKHNGREIRLPSTEVEQRLSTNFKPYIKEALNLKGIKQNDD